MATDHYHTDTPGNAVQLLHRDEFDVAWQTNNLGPSAVGTQWTGRFLEEEYQWRRNVDYYEHNGNGDEDSEDEDEED